MYFLKLLPPCKSKIRVSSLTLKLHWNYAWEFWDILWFWETTLRFISGIPGMSWGKMLLPKYLHVLILCFMVCVFPLALAETTFWWIVGFLPICVSFEICKEACAFQTGRDFLMRWLNGMEVELMCLNSVVVSVLLSRTGSVAVWMPDSRRVEESQEEGYSGYISLTLGWMKATI